jgi:hypothetical protein
VKFHKCLVDSHQLPRALVLHDQLLFGYKTLHTRSVIAVTLQPHASLVVMAINTVMRNRVQKGLDWCSDLSNADRMYLQVIMTDLQMHTFNSSLQYAKTSWSVAFPSVVAW